MRTGTFALMIGLMILVSSMAGGAERALNVPPPGFIALFNGEDLTGWHTVKITMIGRTLSAEYDGELLYDRFEYPERLLSTEPSPILLQKHSVVRGQGLGRENPCPIEFRNVFIKEINSSE
ncbi:MAG: hypothetical protein JSW66_05800 [Phycisphaerales bacterium]|nr:MAG: hypothetical protein JSW66_05800 [Phycisphaerales bacterium]